jgi:hypothetical protein
LEEAVDLSSDRLLMNDESNFIKICAVGVEFFNADKQTDGRTDTTKLIVVCRNVAKAPKNE